MSRPMPPPQRVIEQDDGDDRFEPTRPMQQLEQTDTLAHDPRPDRLQQRRLDQRHQSERYAPSREIADKAAEFRLDSAPKRSDAFGEKHETAGDHDDRRGDGERWSGAKLLRDSHSGCAHIGRLTSYRPTHKCEKSPFVYCSGLAMNVR